MLALRASVVEGDQGAMRHFGTRRSLRGWSSLLLALWLLAGCKRPIQPAITITKVPLASIGGTNFAWIEGDVSNAREGQRVVLYTKVGSWWVQPDAEQPYTELPPGGHWRRNVHLGTDYAALLVDASYQPPSNTDALPANGNGIIAVKVVPGTPNSAHLMHLKTLRFSGYDWRLVDTDNDRGGSVHAYRPDNVSVDSKGLLHLRITLQSDRWSCSEMILDRSFGYGTYAVTVDIPARLEPAAVLSIFTWSRTGVDVNHREMDINVSRWGNAKGKNVEYIVEPYYISTNVYGLEVNPGETTFSLRWQPGSAVFESKGMGKAGARLYPPHTFTGNIPTPGDESLRMNFCEVSREQSPLKHEAEIVVEHFQYLP